MSVLYTDVVHGSVHGWTIGEAGATLTKMAIGETEYLFPKAYELAGGDKVYGLRWNGETYEVWVIESNQHGVPIWSHEA